MATRMDEIAIPLSEFYVGVTTLVPDSAAVKSGTVIDVDAYGVPTDGGWMHIGATIGEGTWEYSRDTIELEIEQVSGIPADGIIYNNDSVTLTIPIAQLEYTRLERATQGDSYSGTGGSIVTVGGKTEPEMFSVCLIAEHRAGKGVFHQFVIYKAISSEGTSLSFSKADAMTYEMTCRGLIDIDRDKGDQLGFAFIAEVPV